MLIKRQLKIISALSLIVKQGVVYCLATTARGEMVAPVNWSKFAAVAFNLPSHVGFRDWFSDLPSKLLIHG